MYHDNRWHAAVGDAAYCSARLLPASNVFVLFALRLLLFLSLLSRSLARGAQLSHRVLVPFRSCLRCWYGHLPREAVRAWAVGFVSILSCILGSPKAVA